MRSLLHDNQPVDEENLPLPDSLRTLTVEQMRALLDVAQLVNASLDLQTVLDSILEGIGAVMLCSSATLLLPDSSGGLALAGRSGAVTLQPASAGTPASRRAFAGGEPVILGDDRSSQIAVPLKRGAMVVGVLEVERAGSQQVSQQELDLVLLFASQAAIAMENARLYAAQQQRVIELQTIQNIVQQLTPLHDVRSIAQLISRELSRLIRYHSLRILVLDPLAQELASILPEEPEQRLRVGEGLAGWIAAHGQPLLIANTLTNERAGEWVGSLGQAESFLGAPLIYQGRVQGVITLSTPGADRFDENSLRLLEILAAQAALAFDRARLYAELRQDAITDELTGLYNRRFLGERLREEQARARRSGHPLACLLVDIDRFKGVNDRYGHGAGDVVLQELAGLIRTVVRTEDVVARYGGEEFCLLLPEVPLQDAQQVAERLRTVIADHRLPEEAGREQITVSVGMAMLEEGQAEDELFRQADQAMYRGKRHGGNAVWVSERGSLRPAPRAAQGAPTGNRA
jgi:diguanylate cyclase (GGDEF)-like protein